MGTLKPGDVILTINGQSLEHCNLREAAHLLRNAGDIVTLTVSKGCEYSESLQHGPALQYTMNQLGFPQLYSHHLRGDLIWSSFSLQRLLVRLSYPLSSFTLMAVP